MSRSTATNGAYHTNNNYNNKNNVISETPSRQHTKDSTNEILLHTKSSTTTGSETKEARHKSKTKSATTYKQNSYECDDIKEQDDDVTLLDVNRIVNDTKPASSKNSASSTYNAVVDLTGDGSEVDDDLYPIFKAGAGNSCKWEVKDYQIQLSKVFGHDHRYHLFFFHS